VFCLIAIPLALMSPWIASGLYLLVTLLSLVPDRRIEGPLRSVECICSLTQ